MKIIKPKRTVDIAVIQLRKAILDGTYPPETKLPPERQLAEKMGINRLTLRAALSHLESEGLVQPRHGQGVLVLDYKKFGSLNLMAHLNNDEALIELFTLRRSFAAEAIAFACERASVTHINKLRSIARRQEDIEDSEAFLEGDLEFTKQMIIASQSLPLTLLFNTLERITRTQPNLAMQMLADRKAACSSYYALIALIRYRDPDLARKAILGLTSEKDNLKLKKALAKD